jgi:hypothetical protein
MEMIERVIEHALAARGELLDERGKLTRLEASRRVLLEPLQDERDEMAALRDTADARDDAISVVVIAILSSLSAHQQSGH